MKIQESIAQHIMTRRDDCNALLIYDPEGLYRDLVTGLASEEITVVDGEKSIILGREAALDAWRRIGQDQEDKHRLIVYIPV